MRLTLNEEILLVYSRARSLHQEVRLLDYSKGLGIIGNFMLFSESIGNMHSSNFENGGNGRWKDLGVIIPNIGFDKEYKIRIFDRED